MEKKKFSKPGFDSTWTKNSQMFKLDLEKAEEPEIKLSTPIGSQKKQENFRKYIYFCFTDWTTSKTDEDRTEITISIMTKLQSKTSSAKHYRPSSRKSTAVRLSAQRSEPKAGLSQAFPGVLLAQEERAERRGRAGTADLLSNHQAEFRAPPAGGSEDKSAALIHVPPQWRQYEEARNNGFLTQFCSAFQSLNPLG